MVLIENLRRLAERVATNKAAREVANLCCDRIETYPLRGSTRSLALLNQRGVGRVFLAQMAQRLQDHRPPADARYLEWLRPRRCPTWPRSQAQQAAGQAADNLSVSNAITSLRAIGDADWPEIVAATSVADAADAAARRCSTPSTTTRATRRCTPSSGWRARAAAASARSRRPCSA